LGFFDVVVDVFLETTQHGMNLYPPRKRLQLEAPSLLE